jgi:hypothetical protein
MTNTENAGLISTVGIGSPTETYDFTSEKNLITVTFTAKKAGTATISYTMKEAMALDAENQYDSETGKPLTTDVSTNNTATTGSVTPTAAPTVAPTEENTDKWQTAPTTAATELSVKKGDKIAYWIEVNIPTTCLDVPGWTADFLYDTTMLEYDSTFCTKGYASETAAIDYALGFTTTPATLPGGTLCLTHTILLAE